MQRTYSFIVPVYNRPQEIRELLESFLVLHFSDPFEIVIVEDGSTETAEAVVKEFSESLEISYYFKPNSGPGDSRNFGMQKAKELMYTGRSISAKEAKNLNIAMEVFAQDKLYDEAVALARRMQDTSPTAFAITKRVTNQTFDNNAASIMEMEAAGQAVCLATNYHVDAVKRFVDKRPLRFNWETK